MAKPSKPSVGTTIACLRERKLCSQSEMLALERAILAELLTLFYPPFRADDDAEMAALAVTALEAYIADLKRYPEATLRSGWAEVRRRHRVERWPIIGDIVDACERIAASGQVNGGVAAGIPAWAETWAKATGTGRVASWLKDVSLDATEPRATLWCRTGFARDILVNDRHLILDGVRKAHPKVTDLDLIARDDPKRRAA